MRASAVRMSTPSPPQVAIDSRETALDDVIAASFPASDPPSWTTGTATVASASSSASLRRVLNGRSDRLRVPFRECR